MTRKIARRPASAEVQISSPQGEKAGALLRDISAYGCNLASDAAWLRPGAFITLMLGTERSVQGIVRWRREASSGIEFLRPIPFAEADLLDALCS